MLLLTGCLTLEGSVTFRGGLRDWDDDASADRVADASLITGNNVCKAVASNQYKQVQCSSTPFIIHSGADNNTGEAVKMPENLTQITTSPHRVRVGRETQVHRLWDK